MDIKLLEQYLEHFIYSINKYPKNKRMKVWLNEQMNVQKYTHSGHKCAILLITVHRTIYLANF